MITANPPYIPTADIPSLQREITEHENIVALDGGSDGLDQYRMLAVKAKKALNPDGYLLAEVGINQSGAVEKLFSGWREVRFIPDYNHIPRVLVARK